MVLMQDIPSAEAIETVLTMREVTVVGALVLFIIYLIWTKYKTDKRLEEVMDNHIRDLKESDKDKAELAENFIKMVNNLKEIIHNK
jgi:hypothetical protein